MGRNNPVYSTCTNEKNAFIFNVKNYIDIPKYLGFFFLFVVMIYEMLYTFNTNIQKKQ